MTKAPGKAPHNIQYNHVDRSSWGSGALIFTLSDFCLATPIYGDMRDSAFGAIKLGSENESPKAPKGIFGRTPDTPGVEQRSER